MLTSKQRVALEAKAKEAGVDPAKLIAEAEQLAGSGDETPDAKSKDSKSAPAAEQPKLFMYLLPFVTVREVREKWLGLTESFAGDDEVASSWAAKQGAPSGGTPDDAA